MAKITPIQPSLNAGEFSPRMDARTDFVRYPLACAKLENMLPLAQGGATRRPGTRFVAEVKDSGIRSRLLPFEFSEEQAYLLEAGAGFFRFYKDRGQIVVAATDAAILNGTFDTDLSSWTASSVSQSTDKALFAAGGTLDQTITVTAGYETIEHVLQFTLRGLAGHSVKLRIGTTSGGQEIKTDKEFATGYHSYAFTPAVTTFYIRFSHSSGTPSLDDVAFFSNVAVEIATPYEESDLANLNIAQSADIMYIAHADYPIYRLERSSHASWSLVEVLFSDGPYLKMNVTGTTIAPSATSGSAITLTASTNIFEETDVGRLVRIEHGSTWGNAQITAYTSATSVKANVRRNFGGTTAQKDWRLGSWSDSSGYPNIVFFYEQRLGFAGTATEPQSFWLSQSADFENMQPDDGAGAIADDDAIDYTISADQVNVIRWMVAYKSLIIGTAGGEWIVKSSGPVLTPTDVDVKRQTGYGSAKLDPALMRGRLVYVQKAKRKILEFAYTLESDGFNSVDMTLMSDHISKGGIESMAYQQELESTLWCIRRDGIVPTFTYQPDQQVFGWARQIFGGSFAGGNAVAESVSVAPGLNRDETWVIIKRTIDGQTKRYIEYLEAPYETGDDQADAFYLDSGLTLDKVPVPITAASQANPIVLTAVGHGLVDGDLVLVEDVTGMVELNNVTFKIANKTVDTFELKDKKTSVAIDGTLFGGYVSGGTVTEKVTTITGLNHLEGETVNILSHGAVHPDEIVSGGQVTLESPASKVQCGLGYTHTYMSLKWEGGAPGGTAQGHIKRIDGVTMMLLDSLNARVGPDADNFQSIPFRDVTDNMDTAVPLFTGERYTEFDGDFDTDTRVLIEGDDPVPFTLLAVSPRLKVNSQ